MKKNKRKKQKKKYIIFLFSVLLVFGIIIIITNKTIYKIEDRTTNIKEEKKKDEGHIRTIGWIRVQGTKIDYPIIAYEHGYNPKKETDKKESFAYNLIREEELFNKVNIMGHNILNLSTHPRLDDKKFTRFESLMSFIYYDFAKKNKYIQYTIDGNNYLYKIYGVRVYDSYKNVETIIEKTYNDNEIVKYANKVKKDSIYKYNVKIDGKDNLISLITCTRFYGPDTSSAFVVDARMIRKGEKAKNYTVKKTDNYKKILKIMKGDGENEV